MLPFCNVMCSCRKKAYFNLKPYPTLLKNYNSLCSTIKRKKVNLELQENNSNLWREFIGNLDKRIGRLNRDCSSSVYSCKLRFETEKLREKSIKFRKGFEEEYQHFIVQVIKLFEDEKINSKDRRDIYNEKWSVFLKSVGNSLSSLNIKKETKDLMDDFKRYTYLKGLTAWEITCSCPRVIEEYGKNLGEFRKIEKAECEKICK